MDYYSHVMDYQRYRRGRYLFGQGFPRPKDEIQAIGWDFEAMYYREYLKRL